MGQVNIPLLEMDLWNISWLILLIFEPGACFNQDTKGCKFGNTSISLTASYGEGSGGGGLGECPTCFESWNSSCYFFGNSSKLLTWSQANSFCQDVNENATLPIVHSQEEDQFIQSRAPSHPFWLGACRARRAEHSDKKSWVWTDGT